MIRTVPCHPSPTVPFQSTTTMSIEDSDGNHNLHQSRNKNSDDSTTRNVDRSVSRMIQPYPLPTQQQQIEHLCTKSLVENTTTGVPLPRTSTWIGNEDEELLSDMVSGNGASDLTQRNIRTTNEYINQQSPTMNPFPLPSSAKSILSTRSNCFREVPGPWDETDVNFSSTKNGRNICQNNSNQTNLDDNIIAMKNQRSYSGSDVALSSLSRSTPLSQLNEKMKNRLLWFDNNKTQTSDTTCSTPSCTGSTTAFSTTTTTTTTNASQCSVLDDTFLDSESQRQNQQHKVVHGCSIDPVSFHRQRMADAYHLVGEYQNYVFDLENTIGQLKDQLLDYEQKHHERDSSSAVVQQHFERIGTTTHEMIDHSDEGISTHSMAASVKSSTKDTMLSNSSMGFEKMKLSSSCSSSSNSCTTNFSNTNNKKDNKLVDHKQFHSMASNSNNAFTSNPVVNKEDTCNTNFTPSGSPNISVSNKKNSTNQNPPPQGERNDTILNASSYSKDGQGLLTRNETDHNLNLMKTPTSSAETCPEETIQMIKTLLVMTTDLKQNDDDVHCTSSRRDESSTTNKREEYMKHILFLILNRVEHMNVETKELRKKVIDVESKQKEKMMNHNNEKEKKEFIHTINSLHAEIKQKDLLLHGYRVDDLQSTETIIAMTQKIEELQNEIIKCDEVMITLKTNNHHHVLTKFPKHDSMECLNNHPTNTTTLTTHKSQSSEEEDDRIDSVIHTYQVKDSRIQIQPTKQQELVQSPIKTMNSENVLNHIRDCIVMLEEDELSCHFDDTNQVNYTDVLLCKQLAATIDTLQVELEHKNTVLENYRIDEEKATETIIAMTNKIKELQDEILRCDIMILSLKTNMEFIQRKNGTVTTGWTSTTSLEECKMGDNSAVTALPTTRIHETHSCLEQTTLKKKNNDNIYAQDVLIQLLPGRCCCCCAKELQIDSTNPHDAAAACAVVQPCCEMIQISQDVVEESDDLRVDGGGVVGSSCCENNTMREKLINKLLHTVNELENQIQVQDKILQHYRMDEEKSTETIIAMTRKIEELQDEIIRCDEIILLLKSPPPPLSPSSPSKEDHNNDNNNITRSNTVVEVVMGRIISQ